MSNDRDSAVRPIGEALNWEEGCVPCGQEVDEEEREEGRTIKGRSRIANPSKQ